MIDITLFDVETGAERTVNIQIGESILVRPEERILSWIRSNKYVDVSRIKVTRKGNEVLFIVHE